MHLRLKLTSVLVVTSLQLLSAAALPNISKAAQAHYKLPLLPLCAVYGIR